MWKCMQLSVSQQLATTAPVWRSRFCLLSTIFPLPFLFYKILSSLPTTLAYLLHCPLGMTPAHRPCSPSPTDHQVSLETFRCLFYALFRHLLLLQSFWNASC